MLGREPSFTLLGSGGSRFVFTFAVQADLKARLYEPTQPALEVVRAVVEADLEVRLNAELRTPNRT